MKDEKKLEIKKKIKEWIENLKNYQEEGRYGYNIPFANMVDLVQQAYSLYGYKSKYDKCEYVFTQKIINEVKEILDGEYDRLNCIDNLYEYVPEEWLDDSVTAENIINEINAKWQNKDEYGKIEQEYWVEVGVKIDEKGTKYAVYQRYCGNEGYHHAIYGDYGESLKDCILAFWENIGKSAAFTRNFWD